MCYQYLLGLNLARRVSEELGLKTPAGALLRETPGQRQMAKDVHLTDAGLIVRGAHQNKPEEGRQLTLDEMAFGFPNLAHGGVVGNARQETAFERPMFSDSMKKRRCVIPASAFYEWDPARKKVMFRSPDESVIYLAGCYLCRGGRWYFVILTTAPNESMEGIHDRMPLMIARENVPDWVFSESAARRLKNETMPSLAVTEPKSADPSYEQLRLE